jgi:hypothetical protein
MSFNKRYVGLSTIKSHINNGGIQSLETLFSKKIDAFIFTDVISSRIYDMYIRKEFKKIECLIIPKKNE